MSTNTYMTEQMEFALSPMPLRMTNNTIGNKIIINIKCYGYDNPLTVIYEKTIYHYVDINKNVKTDLSPILKEAFELNYRQEKEGVANGISSKWRHNHLKVDVTISYTIQGRPIQFSFVCCYGVIPENYVWKIRNYDYSDNLFYGLLTRNRKIRIFRNVPFLLTYFNSGLVSVTSPDDPGDTNEPGTLDGKDANLELDDPKGDDPGVDDPKEPEDPNEPDQPGEPGTPGVDIPLIEERKLGIMINGDKYEIDFGIDGGIDIVSFLSTKEDCVNGSFMPLNPNLYYPVGVPYYYKFIQVPVKFDDLVSHKKIYLRWKNSIGGLSYFLFDVKTTSEKITESYFDTDVRSNVTKNGIFDKDFEMLEKESGAVFSCGANDIETDELPDIIDLFSSMYVQVWDTERDGYIPVRISGTPNVDMTNTLHPINFNVIFPKNLKF